MAVVFISLGVAILIPIVHHYQLRAAVNAYIAELKARGEPMDLAQVIPPSVPAEQNGVLFISNALAKLEYESVAGSNTPPAMRMIAPGKAMIGRQRPNIIGFDATNSWEDLGRELAAAKSELDSFQYLTNHPVLDFNVEYQKGFDLLLPHLAPLKRSALWLSASAVYNLHQQNPKSACTDVRAMLALVKGETDERILISQLVRIAIAAIGEGATWEILRGTNASDEDLAQLQRGWQSLDFSHSIEQSFVYERAENLLEYEQIRKSSDRFNKLWGYFYSSDVSSGESFFPKKQRALSLRKWDELRWRWFWSYRDEVRGLKAYQVLIETTRRAETNGDFRIIKSLAGSNLPQQTREPGDGEGLRNFFLQSTFGSDAALRKSARMETARNTVVTAIALRRYQLRHHQLPAALEKLTPDLLPTVPVDCMDGESLRYRRNTDGTFVLYSVGEDGKDDGGDPSLPKNVESSSFYWQSSRALDWVWPQAATPEEIQAWYVKQAKN